MLGSGLEAATHLFEELVGGRSLSTGTLERPWLGLKIDLASIFILLGSWLCDLG